MTSVDNETFVYRTETTGGAVVDVFHEHHGPDRFNPASRWIYRVVCEMCNDVQTTLAEQASLEAAASRAGAHAGLCTLTPRRLAVAA